MKKFVDILGMTQRELKTYLSNYLCGTGYKINVDDGYVFAKGDVPVLLIAHMDTARNEIPEVILKQPTENGTRICAENSLIGGDDRCGVWMIMNIIKKVKCNVLFLEDEEIGCVGARKFASSEHTTYINENVSFMIELDRRGKNDCVFYSNDNRDFIKYIEEKTGTKESIGSMSDISVIMPETGVAGVNLSCGYYKEHTKDEYIMIDEMDDMMWRVQEFLESETEFPKYKYMERKHEYKQWSIDDYILGRMPQRRSTLNNRALNSLGEICLTVTLDDGWVTDEGIDLEYTATGSSPAECWAKLFLEHEDLCFSMISDYYFE